jgi:hypothetical protein
MAFRSWSLDCLLLNLTSIQNLICLLLSNFKQLGVTFD